MYTVLNVVLGYEKTVTFICNESQVQEVIDFIGVWEGSAEELIEDVEANFDCRAVSPTTYNPFNWLIEEDEHPRTCSYCGKGMSEGYCINGGEAYYCSDECLHEHYTEEEYLEMYDEGNGDSYWTEWEEE